MAFQLAGIDDTHPLPLESLPALIFFDDLLVNILLLSDLTIHYRTHLLTVNSYQAFNGFPKSKQQINMSFVKVNITRFQIRSVKNFTVEILVNTFHLTT